LLLAYQAPLFGNYIPGPQGNIDGPVDGTITSRGIAGNDLSYVTLKDNEAAASLGLTDQHLAPYVGGSVAEVFAQAFLGDTAPGLEYASQVSSMGFSTIDQLDHSGGVMRGLEGSRYLGYYGIGVSQNFSAQGPAIGYYNNVQYIGLNLSPGLQEPTSTLAWATSWALGGGSVGTGVTSIWNNGPHLQPGLGSVWDLAAPNLLQH
jgi:hypothetical protein